MTNVDIAHHVVETLCNRADDNYADALGETWIRAYPHVRSDHVYISVCIGDITIWDDEDENDQHEDGETKERALVHAEKNLCDYINSLRLMLPKPPVVEPPEVEV